MFKSLTVMSWANADTNCPIRYVVDGERHLTFVFGGDGEEFEFGLNANALRTLLLIGTEALAELDARAGQA
jgi:hypothetical protein